MKPKINSRNKGKGGELEVRDLIVAHGFEAARGQQFSGGNDSPDVRHNIPGVHVEVKRTEVLNLYKAMDQAEADCPEGSFPTVWHRKSRREWVVILPAEEFLRLVGGRKVIDAEIERMLS